MAALEGALRFESADSSGVVLEGVRNQPLGLRRRNARRRPSNPLPGRMDAHRVKESRREVIGSGLPPSASPALSGPTAQDVLHLCLTLGLIGPLIALLAAVQMAFLSVWNVAVRAQWVCYIGGVPAALGRVGRRCNCHQMGLRRALSTLRAKKASVMCLHRLSPDESLPVTASEPRYPNEASTESHAGTKPLVDHDSARPLLAADGLPKSCPLPEGGDDGPAALRTELWTSRLLRGMPKVARTMDAFWLGDEEPSTNPCHITFVCLFERFEVDFLRKRIASCAMVHDSKLRSIAREVMGRLCWVDCGADVTNEQLALRHVNEICIDIQDTYLHDVVSEIVSKPLSRDEPLWEVNVVQQSPAERKSFAKGSSKRSVGASEIGMSSCTTEVGAAAPSGLGCPLTFPVDAYDVSRDSWASSFNSAGGGTLSADELCTKTLLVWKMHHALADGIAIAYWLNTYICDPERAEGADTAREEANSSCGQTTASEEGGDEEESPVSGASGNAAMAARGATARGERTETECQSGRALGSPPLNDDAHNSDAAEDCTSIPAVVSSAWVGDRTPTQQDDDVSQSALSAELSFASEGSSSSSEDNQGRNRSKVVVASANKKALQAGEAKPKKARAARLLKPLKLTSPISMFWTLSRLIPFTATWLTSPPPGGSRPCVYLPGSRQDPQQVPMPYVPRHDSLSASISQKLQGIFCMLYEFVWLIFGVFREAWRCRKAPMGARLSGKRHVSFPLQVDLEFLYECQRAVFHATDGDVHPTINDLVSYAVAGAFSQFHTGFPAFPIAAASSGGTVDDLSTTSMSHRCAGTQQSKQARQQYCPYLFRRTFVGQESSGMNFHSVQSDTDKNARSDSPDARALQNKVSSITKKISSSTASSAWGVSGIQVKSRRRFNAIFRRLLYFLENFFSSNLQLETVANWLVGTLSPLLHDPLPSDDELSVLPPQLVPSANTSQPSCVCSSREREGVETCQACLACRPLPVFAFPNSTFPPPRELTLNVALAVSYRSSMPKQLDNYISTVLTKYPLDDGPYFLKASELQSPRAGSAVSPPVKLLENKLRRLKRTKHTLDEIKRRMDTLAVPSLMFLQSHLLPRRLSQWLMHVMSSKLELLFSNLMGPSSMGTMDGGRFGGVGVWPPGWNNIGVTVGAVSCMNKFNFTCMMDEAMLEPFSCENCRLRRCCHENSGGDGADRGVQGDCVGRRKYFSNSAALDNKGDEVMSCVAGVPTLFTFSILAELQDLWMACRDVQVRTTSADEEINYYHLSDYSTSGDQSRPTTASTVASVGDRRLRRVEGQHVAHC